MLDAHPDLALTPESHWIPRFYVKKIGVDREGMVTPELLPALFSHPRFERLSLETHDVAALLEGEEFVRYSDFVSRLLDLYGRKRGKVLVGDKTPPYVRKIAVLHELWPKALFIHIVRDGRDVCLSMLSWSKAQRSAGRRAGWEVDPVTTTALWWEWQIRLAREAAVRMPSGSYHELLYEDLVADPAGRCRWLCDALSLDFDERMLRYHEGREPQDPHLTDKRSTLPPTRGLRDWRKQMEPDDLARFEAASGRLLDELGYERAGRVPSPAASEHAEHFRALFDGEPRPQAW
jgi:hypothetical protein